MTTPQPVVVTSKTALREQVRALRRAGRTIGLVPTMGALHAGHASLVATARATCDVVIVTIFVNPTQFAPHEDYHVYPRTLAADLQLLQPYDVDLIFAPESQADVYAADHATYVDPLGVALGWEGDVRPGHFRGVATVVLKLFHLAQPDIAFFGAKDFQQARVIQQMTRDLDLDVEVRICPTVREIDGLALSSRNRYLGPADRQVATVLSRALAEAESLVAAGETNAETVVTALRNVLAGERTVAVDYAAVVDPATMKSVAQIAGPVVALVAARLGTTRLIDNRWLTPHK